MLPAHVNAVVPLTHDVPTLWLNRADVGAIRSISMSPTDHYEVEFHRPGQSSVRALLDSGAGRDVVCRISVRELRLRRAIDTICLGGPSTANWTGHFLKPTASKAVRRRTGNRWKSI